MSTRTTSPEAVAAEMPAVPLTIEGYSILHQMMKFRWSDWRELSDAERRDLVQEAGAVLAKMEQNPKGQSALYSLLGHKGDLMLVHFRESSEALPGHAAEPLHLLLSHGSPARRGQELVHAAYRRTPASNERARPGRSPLCGRGEADHLWLDRI